MAINRNAFILAGLSAFLSTHAVAEDTKNATVEHGMTMTAQSASDDRINDEFLFSYDFVADVPLSANGHLVVYAEASKTPRQEGVSSQIGEANGDSGSALDAEGKGRFQVSEFFYQHDMGESFFNIGLIDATGLLDGSEIANDEGASFISTDLVNNATIAFPDYTIGVGYHYQGSGAINATFFVGDSDGLAGDINGTSYSNLLNTDYRAGGSDTGAQKGIFAAGEIDWSAGNHMVKVGAWVNTGDFETQSKTNSDLDSASGVYGIWEGKFSALTLNVRLGVTTDDVSEADSFTSIAGEYAVGPGAFGLGFALIGRSTDDNAPTTEKDDRSTTEAYYRWEFGENYSVTPAVAIFTNPGFDSSNTQAPAAGIEDSVTVTTVRFAAGF